jgi:4-hydroxybenzoate polyprenyltransferase
LFFALKITDFNLLLQTSIAFIAFCFVASSVYIFNDWFDIEEDKKHPVKKNRPLASGKVSKHNAALLMTLLCALGLSIAFIINSTIAYLLVAYFVLNLLYTLKLKHFSIVDIFIISSGFVIRLFVGAYVANVPLSLWIIIITFLLAIFISLAKRRDDVLIYAASGNKTRTVVDGYNLKFLDTAMMVMASVIIVSYIMYTVSPDVIAKMHSDKLYFTVVFVILGLFRYMQITFVEGKSGSPTEIFLKDRFMQFVLLGWIIIFGIIIYR